MSIKCGKAWLELKEYQKAKDILLKVQADIKVLLEISMQSSDLAGVLTMHYSK